MYLIWSNEHHLWWRSNHTGYTSRIAEAGRYTHAEALAIATDALGGSTVLGWMPELPVAVHDVEVMTESHRRRFPQAPMEVWE